MEKDLFNDYTEDDLIMKEFEDIELNYELWGDQIFEYAFRTVAEKYGDEQALIFMMETYNAFKEECDKGDEVNE